MPRTRPQRRSGRLDGRTGSMGDCMPSILGDAMHRPAISIRIAMTGRELSLVHFRIAFIRVCDFRADRCSPARASMAQASSDWHGRVVYFMLTAFHVDNGKKPAPVEGT